MVMQRNRARLALLALVVLPLTGCTFFEELGAVRTFKDANLAYGRGFYEEAIELYEEVITVIEAGGGDSEIGQQLKAAYFYIGNSYDSMYQPGDQSPENIHNLMRRSAGTRRRRRTDQRTSRCCRCSISWRRSVPTRRTTRRGPSRCFGR